MMSVNIRQVNLHDLSESDLADINEVLNNAGSATIFHSVEWNRLLSEQFGLQYVALLATVDHKPAGFYLYTKHNDHTCQSPAIHFQSVYGGPVAINNDPHIIFKLLMESEKRQPTAYFQIWTPPDIDPRPYRKCSYQVQEMYTPIINLDCPEEEQWSRLDRDKRRVIRKAINQGAVVVEGDTQDLENYRDMVSATLSNGGHKSLPLGFYKRVLDSLKPLGRAKFFIVKLCQNIISGTVILYFKDTVFGWDIGWRREFAHLSPNDLLVWEVAKRASRAGYKRFDLLRFEPERLPGIAKWKKAFGSEIASCYLLRKATLGFRLSNPFVILFTQPSRVVKKVQSIFLEKGER
ncbi:MAG: GNAT family N-acetyltransferase [Chloroflexi bacterium]|nr:GNAT family N-acetyltransferase [Chloroflexota bacterium]